jgi:hypothetical protein
MKPSVVSRALRTLLVVVGVWTVTHKLAACGTISWPLELRKCFVFNIAFGAAAFGLEP